MPSTIRCPACGHPLVALDLPAPTPASVARDPSSPLLLTVAEAARALAISRNATYALLESDLPVVRMGRSIRVPRAALEAWVGARTVGDSG